MAQVIGIQPARLARLLRDGELSEPSERSAHGTPAGQLSWWEAVRAAAANEFAKRGVKVTPRTRALLRQHQFAPEPFLVVVRADRKILPVPIVLDPAGLAEYASSGSPVVVYDPRPLLDSLGVQFDVHPSE